MECENYFYPRVCNEIKKMTEKMEYINQFFYIIDDGRFMMRRGEKLIETTREQIYIYFEKLNQKKTIREWFFNENDIILYSEHIQLLQDSFKPKEEKKEPKKITKEEPKEEKPKEKKKSRI
jgi:hypothetical protein